MLFRPGDLTPKVKGAWRSRSGKCGTEPNPSPAVQGCCHLLAGSGHAKGDIFPAGKFSFEKRSFLQVSFSWQEQGPAAVPGAKALGTRALLCSWLVSAFPSAGAAPLGWDGSTPSHGSPFSISQHLLVSCDLRREERSRLLLRGPGFAVPMQHMWLSLLLR